MALLREIAASRRRLAGKEARYGLLAGIRLLHPDYCQEEKILSDLKERLGTMENQRTNSNPTLSPIPWIASDADFAELFLALREKGYIRAETDAEALKTAAPHFTGVNRDSRTLAQGRKNRTTPHFDKIEQATPSRKNRNKH